MNQGTPVDFRDQFTAKSLRLEARMSPPTFALSLIYWRWVAPCPQKTFSYHRFYPPRENLFRAVYWRVKPLPVMRTVGATCAKQPELSRSFCLKASETLPLGGLRFGVLQQRSSTRSGSKRAKNRLRGHRTVAIGRDICHTACEKSD